MSTNNTDHPIIVIARHQGTCSDCGGQYEGGDRITRPNHFELWRHASCPRTKFDFDPGDVCPVCFTVRATSGACSC
ncbi:hypothetical protein [Microbacterium sp. 3J1]|uniref:hypothetical protein n=1 Tax=Microbacterium sp. 3J1 TaxID=861269 RepID=UPI000AECFF91|nr:hypothetical protein [Microbacterium sp. 3J1]